MAGQQSLKCPDGSVNVIQTRPDEFEAPAGTSFLFGADFGYANDPTCLVRMYIQDKKLWIDYEAYGVGVEIAELHAFFAAVPESTTWKIIADSARPETISHLTNQSGNYKGFNIVGAEKGKGSVEDGISFLRSFEEIIIHPRCKGAISDFNNYRWKIDKITEEILPIPLDKSNNAPDACRYALECYRNERPSILDVL